MRRTLTALAAFAVLAGCAVIVVPENGDGSVQFRSAFGADMVQGNGQSVVEKRQIAALDGVEINGSMQVEVRVGQATSLQVEGDSNILPLLHTEANGNTLRIWVDGSFRTSNPLRVVYTTPALHQLTSNGSGSAVVTGLNGGTVELALKGSGSVRASGSVDRLDAHLNGSGGLSTAGLRSGSTTARLNGSGRLDLGQLSGETLNLELRGSGGANASGNVRSMTVRVTGSGSAELSGLTSQSAELSSNGSGSISAAVTQSLVADANGSGRVTVYGNPSQRNVSGKRVTIVQ